MNYDILQCGNCGNLTMAFVGRLPMTEGRSAEFTTCGLCLGCFKMRDTPLLARRCREELVNRLVGILEGRNWECSGANGPECGPID